MYLIFNDIWIINITTNSIPVYKATLLILVQNTVLQVVTSKKNIIFYSLQKLKNKLQSIPPHVKKNAKF